MKSVLAFGDSNTWGLVPGSASGERYPREVRWTGLLNDKSGELCIIEEGLCGRTTAFEDALRPGRRAASVLPFILESQSPLDGAVIMLGTNDTKPVYGASAYAIGRGLTLCLDEMEKFLPPEDILVVSPILLGEEVWYEDKDPEFSESSVETGRGLKAVYREIAENRGHAFLAAEDYVTADHADDEHMNEKGHHIFADVVYEKLKEMPFLQNNYNEHQKCFDIHYNS